MTNAFSHLLKRLDETPPSWSFQFDRDATFNEMGQFFETATRPDGAFDLKQNPNAVWERIYARLQNALACVEMQEVQAGDLKMWQMYNSGVIVKTSDLIIGVDLVPVLRTYGWNDPDNLTAKMAGLVDFLLITHHHADHYDKQLVERCLDLGKPVLVPESIGVDWDNESNLYVFGDGDCLDLCDTKIVGRRGYHVWRDTMEELPLIYYELTTPGNHTLVFSGDADYTKSFEVTPGKKVDVLYLPWRYPNASYEEGHDLQTATINDALDAVIAKINPAHVILEHYAELEHIYQYYPASYSIASHIKKTVSTPIEWLFWGESMALSS